MSITYGDVPLLLNVGDVQVWLDNYLPLADCRLFSPPLAFSSNRSSARGWSKEPVGLGIPNYPDPPELKINSLYWPTGAMRWGRFLGLANTSAKDKIIALAHPSSSIGNVAQTLKLKDDRDAGTSPDAQTIETTMFLLPPRPITCVPGTAPEVEGLWLLPLVDERFYWQWKDIGALSTFAAATTWAEFIAFIGTGLGVTITATPTIDSKYGTPDLVELTRRYDNAAMLLDAVAHSVGRRAFRRLDGTVRVESVTEAETQLTANVEGSGGYSDWTQVAGDDFSTSGSNAALPAKVRTVFRKVRDSIYLDEEHAVDENAADHVTSTEAGTTVTGATNTLKNFYTTALADFTTGGGTPDNATAVNDLADSLAADFYSWAVKRFDRSFNALKKWEMTGFEDAVEYRWGVLREESGGAGSGRIGNQYEARTRIWSLPQNFGVEEVCQKNDAVAYEGPLLGTLDGALSYGSFATVSVLEGAPPTKTDSTKNVKAYCTILNSGETIAANATVVIAAIDEYWDVIARNCPA